MRVNIMYVSQIHRKVVSHRELDIGDNYNSDESSFKAEYGDAIAKSVVSNKCKYAVCFDKESNPLVRIYADGTIIHYFSSKEFYELMMLANGMVGGLYSIGYKTMGASNNPIIISEDENSRLIAKHKVYPKTVTISIQGIAIDRYNALLSYLNNTLMEKTGNREVNTISIICAKDSNTQCTYFKRSSLGDESWDVVIGAVDA